VGGGGAVAEEQDVAVWRWLVAKCMEERLDKGGEKTTSATRVLRGWKVMGNTLAMV